MRPAPRLDRLLRCALRRELATLDQHARDGAKRMTVLLGVADAHHAAVVELDPSGTLDLQEKSVDRFGDERDRVAGDLRIAMLDIRTGPIRHDTPAFDAAAHALVLELRIKGAEIDDQQVVRNAVERRTKFLGRAARSRQQRFVVSGDEADIGATGGADLVYAKIAFEICANRGAVVAVDRSRGGTRRLPKRLRRR